MEYTYRDIIKAKAQALAREAEFGSDAQIRATLHDLVMFSKRCRGVMSFSYTFEEVEASLGERALRRGHQEALDAGDGSYPNAEK